LNIVAITDGAKVIRHRLLAIFGVLPVVILDWYHLCQKVRNLMSMIALTILRTILKFGKKGYSSYKVQVLNQSSQ
jgi:hypothetical protein